MSALDPQDVSAAAEPIARRLLLDYTALVRERGITFASVVLMDACAEALGVALTPFTDAARRQALDIVREETLELAEANHEQLEEARA